MDHTAFVYVMGPDGKYLTLFSPLQGQTPDDMAAKLRDLIARKPIRMTRRTQAWKRRATSAAWRINGWLSQAANLGAALRAPVG